MGVLLGDQEKRPHSDEFVTHSEEERLDMQFVGIFALMLIAAAVSLFIVWRFV